MLKTVSALRKEFQEKESCEKGKTINWHYLIALPEQTVDQANRIGAEMFVHQPVGFGRDAVRQLLSQSQVGIRGIGKCTHTSSGVEPKDSNMNVVSNLNSEVDE